MKWKEFKKLAKEIDKKSFISEYLKWGDRLINAYNTVTPLERSYKSIVVIGMGGSGIVGDLLRDYIYIKGKNIEVHVYKGRKPSLRILRRSLLIGISHSGNTKETIDTLLNSYKIARETVVITTGGELSRLAREKSWRLVIIEPALAPRAGLPQLFGAALKILDKQLKVGRKIRDVSIKLEKIGRRLSLEERENEAFLFAMDIWGRMPILYGDAGYKGVLHRIKSSFNENSKVPAYYSLFPESYHNEIEIYESPPKDIIPIILRNSNNDSEYLIRYLGEHGIDYLIYNIRGGEALEKILTTIMFFDIVSIYLAYLRKVDPYVIDAINEIKGMRIK